ncbi:MAG: hypothetical protein ACE5IY_20285 [bacterium]
MKKKLFSAFIALLFYSLFVIGFSVADASQQIPLVLSRIGISSISDSAPWAQNTHNGNLIDPMPRPPKIDPMPRPPKVILIDPMPRPPKIDPMPRPPKTR